MNVNIPPAYAGFWRRAAALIVDTVVMLLPLKLVDHFTIPDLQFPCGYLAWMLYVGVCESSNRQATPGKYVLRIKVTDEDGNRLSFARACLRFVLQFVSLIPFGIGFLMAGWTKKKQALHDIICGCLVVDDDRV